MDTMTIRAISGKDINVRILHLGDKYGREDCLTWGEPSGWSARTKADADEWKEHWGDKLGVEFYDATYAGPKFGPLGQFASRYYLETLLERNGGLCLEGSIPEWNINAGEMDKVRSWLRTF